MPDNTPAPAAVRRAQRTSEGLRRRGGLEHPGFRSGRGGVHRRLRLANCEEFIHGREQIIAFLTREWEREREYASYGNELWDFDPDGLMRRREASINDVAIAAPHRRIFGPRAEGDDSGIPLR